VCYNWHLREIRNERCAWQLHDGRDAMYSEEQSTRIYGVITRRPTTRTLAVVYLKSQQQSCEDHTAYLLTRIAVALGTVLDWEARSLDFYDQ
jgi:hypothetical protein